MTPSDGKSGIDQKNASDLGDRAVALAEQLGRIAGTVQGTAESWLNRQSLIDQLALVRDGAAEMLDSLTAGAAEGGATAAAGARGIAADVRRKASQAVSAAMAGRATAMGDRTKDKKRNDKGKKATAAGAASARRADPSRAPGKRRRKPAPTARGLKKSDTRIPKLRTAEAARQRRKSYA